MNICSCLLALVLGWNASAEIIHETVEVKTSVSLRCPHSVGTVTWSRESNGSKVDILTVGVEKDIKHIHDPQKRYVSVADKSLHIRSVTVSDSGRYFCNSEAAVELTVIPPGTTRLHATEGTRVTLTCPPDGGSDIKIWSSSNVDEIKYQKGFYVSSVNQTLTITYVQLKHSGLYYCDGKPAAYLIVTEGQTTTSTPSRPTATSVASPTPLTSTTKRHKKKDGKDKNKGNKTTTTTTTTTRPTTKTVASTTPLTNEDTTSTTKRRKRKERKDKNKGYKGPTAAAAVTTFPSWTLTETATPPLWHMCVRTALGFLYLVIMIGITVTTWRKARQIETGNDL